MGSRVPTGIEPGTTLIPYISHLSVFYSPGENCDSLPAHTKLSGGKVDPEIDLVETKSVQLGVPHFGPITVLVKTATVPRHIPNFHQPVSVIEKSVSFLHGFRPGENCDSLPAHTKLPAGSNLCCTYTLDCRKSAISSRLQSWWKLGQSPGTYQTVQWRLDQLTQSPWAAAGETKVSTRYRVYTRYITSDVLYHAQISRDSTSTWWSCQISI